MMQFVFDQIVLIFCCVIVYFIDVLIVGGLGVVFGGVLIFVFILLGSFEVLIMMLFIGGLIVGLLLFVWFIVYMFMQVGVGLIGMWLQGLWLVLVVDGMLFGFGCSLFCNIIFGFVVVIVVGYFSFLFDGLGCFQGWYDKVVLLFMLDVCIFVFELVVEEVLELLVLLLFLVLLFEWFFFVFMLGFVFVVLVVLMIVLMLDVVFVVCDFVVFVQDFGMIVYVFGIIQDVLFFCCFVWFEVDVVVLLFVFVVFFVFVVLVLVVEFFVVVVLVVLLVFLVLFVLFVLVVGFVVVVVFVFVFLVLVGVLVFVVFVVVVLILELVDDLEEMWISILGYWLVFIWDDGMCIFVFCCMVFGCNFVLEEGVLVVLVWDEMFLLLKMYFEVVVEILGGWVVDWYLMNGFMIVCDGQCIVCFVGQCVLIKLGDVIEIGDCVVMVGGYV